MKIFTRIVVVVAVLGGLFYLFIRSAQNVLTEPYVVARQDLLEWRLSLETPGASTSPILVVRPPQSFASGLYKQIFSRLMESMSGSTGGGLPVILSGEYELSLAGRYTPQILLEAARNAGLESARFEPICVSSRRVSEPGGTRQMHFVLFDSPAFAQFRAHIAREIQASPTAGAFNAASLSPVLIVAATDANFHRWLPISASADRDCLAPIAIN